jgi:FkbM family methyltransferase
MGHDVGITSEYQDYLAWTYFGEEALDRTEFARIAELMSGVEQFIDVGASHGVYTYHANRFLSDADIIAIEPDPERFAILTKNAALWEAGSTNRIRCVMAAASDEEDRSAKQETTFYATGTQISGGLFAVAERSDDYEPIMVPLICVDDLFVRGVRTFVKIDVEGSELRVLKGSRRHIAGGTTTFFTEISWWGDRERGTNSLDVLRFCLSSGLRVDRRLRSDYLLGPELSRLRRIKSVVAVLPPLLLRVAWNRLVPAQVRLLRERRQNERRLARYRRSQGGSMEREKESSTTRRTRVRRRP